MTKFAKMPRKSVVAETRGRGSCCNLEVVKQFLQSDTIPEGYTKNDKRALRRRAKSFVFIKDELYFTGGRSRHNRGLVEVDNEGVENPEDEPDHTQVLRKVVLSEEEQQDIINKAHIGEDGAHFGMEKTTERVSNNYYWMGIIYGVRKTIHACLNCSSRSKTIKSQPLSFQTGFGAGTGNPEVTASGETISCKIAAVAKVSENNDGSGDGNDAGEDEVENVLDGRDEVMDDPCEAETMLRKQELDKKSASLLFSSKDISSYFWQKVEIQLFGPFQAGKKQIFVAVALDLYSQFPEATTIEVLSSATLTNFLLNLFCRYGVMEKLSLLQNQVTKNKEFLINVQDLQHAGISPLLLFPHADALDDRWSHVEKSLERFVSQFPEFWFHCLEACLYPLRISLPTTDGVYNPYYLVHGREPPIPEKLRQHWYVDTPVPSEIQLSEKQEKETADMITMAYGVFSDNPSIPLTAVPPDVICSLPVSSSVGASSVEKEKPKNDSVVDKGILRRRRGRPRLRSKSVEKEEGVKERRAEREMDVAEKLQLNVEKVSYDDDENNRDATYEPEVKSVNAKNQSSQQPTRTSTRQRRATVKAQEADIFIRQDPASVLKTNGSFFLAKENLLLSSPLSSNSGTLASVRKKINESSKANAKVGRFRRSKNHSNTSMPFSAGLSQAFHIQKRKRGRPRKKSTKDDDDDGDEIVFNKMKKKTPSELHCKLIQNMQQLPLDTFYFIIKQCKRLDVFPSGISACSKLLIRRVCQMFDLRNGKLVSIEGRSAGRFIITGEKARIGLLRKAHARGGEHHGRVSVLKYLSDMNVFWKGMSMDLDAFIHSCPECISTNPLGTNMTIPSNPSKPAAITGQVKIEEDPHLSEDEEEESCYEDLIQYLTDNTFSPTTTPCQKLHIQQRSKAFCIINGSLHYKTEKMNATRQVLFSENLKNTAIQEAHIENGQHLSQEDTQAKLRNKYFWSGMTFDILTHIMKCCMKESFSVAPVLHRNPTIQDRVNKIRSYYTDATIPVLNTSAIRCSETDREHENTVDGSGSSHSEQAAGAEETTDSNTNVFDERSVNRILDNDVVQAVEGIIETIGKSLKGEEKSLNVEKQEGQPARQSPFGNIRSRKDAHKCQHCGKFISGNVAFRIHMYKHTGVKPFSCSTCSKTFTTRKSLQVHTRKHTGVKPYLCNQCGREFFRGTSFKYHLKTHARDQVVPLPCDQCDREFPSQNRLDRHKQLKHPAVPKIYMCEHCGKVFTYARSLKCHEQSHINPRKFSCHVCKKEFVRKDYLETHLRTIHPDDPKTQKKLSKKVSPQPQHQEQQQQQQMLPQIIETTPQTAVLKYMNIPAAGLEKCPWNDEHQQAANHITITERPTGHITITEHLASHLEPTGSHITISEHGPLGITIGDHAVNHVTISDGSQIRISEHGGAQIAIEEHAVDHIAVSVADHESVGQAEVKTDTETYQPHAFSLSQPTHTTVHILKQAELPLTSSEALSSHQMPVSSAASHLQSLHTLQHGASDMLLPQETVLLQQEAVPVQYEVECLSADPPVLTEADLSAVHLLAQASLGGQNILQ